MNGRDPEAHALFRLTLMAVGFAGLLALGFFGDDVEQHNLDPLRAYVNDR